MRKVLLHCGLKFSADRIYRVKNYLNYSSLFLLFSFCPHCLKPVLGCAGYDVWNEPVLYHRDGQLSSAQDENTFEHSELTRIYQPSKRQSAALFQLIASGQAEAVKQISCVESNQKSTRGGMLGLSEYSRRAASRSGRDYVLRLQSQKRKTH